MTPTDNIVQWKLGSYQFHQIDLFLSLQGEGQLMEQSLKHF